jgi:3-oxoacyl-[acyl-carrier-protein] synthase I
MTIEPFPPVADVLPHQGRMVLLSHVLEHSRTHTACAVEIGPDAPFLEPGGSVPAWIGIEYMAQCVAAHAGLRSRARGEPAKIGFLIGSRRVEFLTDGFRVGQTLVAEATHTWGESESAAFACRLLDRASGALLVEGSLSVFLPPTLDRFVPGAAP